MATPAMPMERLPMPPDVQAQMGGGGAGGASFSDVGGMLAQRQAAGNPLKSAMDMTAKLWTNVVRGNPKMGVYVQRALAILNAGLEETAKETPGGAQRAEGGGQAGGQAAQAPAPAAGAAGAGTMPG